MNTSHARNARLAAAKEDRLFGCMARHHNARWRGGKSLPPRRTFCSTSTRRLACGNIIGRPLLFQPIKKIRSTPRAGTPLPMAARHGVADKGSGRPAANGRPDAGVQAADRVSAHVARGGPDVRRAVSRTAPWLSELENWPLPARRRLTPQTSLCLPRSTTPTPTTCSTSTIGSTSHPAPAPDQQPAPHVGRPERPTRHARRQIAVWIA
jgi:hypothetical protein